MCSSAEKLLIGACEAKTCKDDSYGCPTCTVNEEFFFTVNGDATCVEKTCSVGFSLVQGECVVNKAPVAKATADKTSITENESVAFNALSSSDSDGSIMSYEWKIGNTILSTQAQFTYSKFVESYSSVVTIFDNNGMHNEVQITYIDSYTVTLTIIDNDGLTAVDTIIIRMNDDFANSVTEATLFSDGTISGKLEKNEDLDYFKIILNSNGNLLIGSIQPNNACAKLLDSSEVEIASSCRTSGININENLAAGVYYLKIKKHYYSGTPIH